MPTSAWDNRRVSVYRTEGVVLRTHKLGEADRIVTLLTREHGRVRAVAKGVRRTSSRIGARLEPFGHVDVQLYSGRTLDGVTQVETLAAYGATLSRDYGRWTAGQAMLETAERLTPEEGQPAVQQFLLLVGGLRALVSGEHDQGLVLDAYLLRSLSVAGWAPTFEDCARCGRSGPHGSFHLGLGRRAVCRVPPARVGDPCPDDARADVGAAHRRLGHRRRQRRAGAAGGVRPGRRVPLVAPRARPAQPPPRRAHLTFRN